MSELLTAKEVAGLLRCSLTTVYCLFDGGHLRGFRLNPDGKGIRIFAESVPEYIARNANGPPAPATKREQAARPLPAPRRPRVSRPGKLRVDLGASD